MSITQRTADLFDFLWEECCSEPADVHMYINRVKHNFNLLELDGKTILDAGCGPGVNTRVLSKKAKIVHAIDIGNLMIPRKINTKNNIVFLQANITNLPYDNDVFDIVCCIGVLHHIKSTNKALKELVRVLKNNGILYIGLYGQGGIATIVVDSLRFIGKIIPLRIFNKALKTLSIRGYRKKLILDRIYVPLEKRYTFKRVRKMLNRNNIQLLRREKTPRKNLLNSVLYGEGWIVIVGKKVDRVSTDNYQVLYSRKYLKL